ncbi:MAG: GDSL-type esterase/lipase family protein [candidate division KSB1 bacterium]|nr:GDSL-type esterase/lipase family protein [candidate division KSB1 bacterium]
MFRGRFVTSHNQHRKPIFVVTYFIFCIALAAGSAMAQQIRIMPLGDSITHGEHGSSPLGGFRDDLAELLLNHSINFTMVGTLNDGVSAYPWHEGHPGKTADYLANNIDTWLRATFPDVVILHIGTNDINSLYSNTDIRDEIERVLTNIWNFNPNIPVMLCSVIPRNDGYNATNTDLCRLIQQLATKKLAENKPIRYVGQNEVWVSNPSWKWDYLYDAFHPNNAGYHVMGEVYFNILMNQITGISQFITDNFDRKNLGMTWKIDGPYKIAQNHLSIESGGNYWWKPAVYIAEMDPIAVAFDWGAAVNSSADGNAGLALHLGSYQPNTNGYLVYKDSRDRKLKLYELKNGAVSQLIHEVSGKQDYPLTGDQFRVAMYTDYQGHHFTCFLNGFFDGDLIDPNKIYSEGKDHFAGLMLAGTANNVVDNFQLIHRKGAAERIYAIWGDEQQGKPETRLADSLVVLVSDKNGNPISGAPVSFTITEGDATIRPPESRNHIEYEAEDGAVTYPMQILSDGAASGGKYVEVPAEYPDDSNAKVVFTFTVAEEADFVVWGRVQSGNYLHDSFKVIMDEQPEIAWHIPGKYEWTWDQVYELNGQDPFIFHLKAGAHTLGIKNREWGSKLDKVIITADLNFQPTGLAKPTQQFYVTNTSGRAHAIVTLGKMPGLVKIKASSPNFSDYAIFTATTLTDKLPGTIAIVSGNNQSGLPGQQLPQPLVVEVKDTEQKVLPNIGVKFEITQGSGASLGTSQQVLTNSEGRASTTLTLGPTTGTYQVKASCPGYSVAPVTFKATATNAVLAISGSCKYYAENRPIDNVQLKTSGTAILTATTNTQGAYILQGLEMGGNYTATPEHAVFNHWSSYLITTYNAALTLRNAVGLEPFSASQIKAADVDKNGTVSAYDAALIAQFAVGLPRSSESHVGEWLFTPAFRSYYELNTNFQNQDYTGILLGDVLGKWNPDYGILKIAGASPLTYLNEADISADNIITVPITFGAEQELIAWQMHLSFDPALLELISVEKTTSGAAMQLIDNYLDGNLTIGMYAAVPIRSSEPLAHIKLRLLKTDRPRIELAVPFFQINNDIAQQGTISLHLNETKPLTFALLQNYPNPFNPQTTITYQLPTAGQVKLVIYNLAGQEIRTLENREQPAGSYDVAWDGRDHYGNMVTSGVYLCHLYFQDQVRTIKLMKVK